MRQIAIKYENGIAVEVLDVVGIDDISKITQLKRESETYNKNIKEQNELVLNGLKTDIIATNRNIETVVNSLLGQIKGLQDKIVELESEIKYLKGED